MKSLLFALLTAVLLTNGVQAQTSVPSPADSATAAVESYRLGTGDKIKVTVFGQEDLSGEFTIDDVGVVRMPMIGQVKAVGATVHDFEAAVTAKLADGYLVNPRVSVEVTNYRPFYIVGEVTKPGEYPYETGMNVMNAVSLAGGFTYRADDAEVYIRHKDSSVVQKMPADSTVPLQPGDIITVKERFF